MTDDIAIYLQQIFEKYQAIAGIVVPSILAGWSLVFIDKFRRATGKSAEFWIYTARWFIAVCAASLIGFLVWRDEHIDKIGLQSRYDDLNKRLLQPNGNTARISVTKFRHQIDNNTVKYVIEVSNINPGSAAHITGYALYAYNTDGGYNFVVSNQILDKMENSIVDSPEMPQYSQEMLFQRPLEYQTKAYLSDNTGASSIKHHQDVVNGQAYLYYYAIFQYRDESVHENKERRLLRYCSFSHKSIGEAVPCPGLNGTKKITRK